ncbi:MAG TPA: T9SS type A sorting domain-containing protein [Flavobacterium sp.]
MKKFYLLLALASAALNAQNVNIPDANFKSRLLAASPSNQTAKDLSGNYFKIDANNDGEIQVTEAANVSYLFVPSFPYISSLEGILSFTNIEVLWCGVNDLTELNLNGLTHLTELVCGYNDLVTLDLTGVPALQTLRCDNNQLTSLNISGLSNLQTVICSINNIASLNAGNLSSLETLECHDNQMTALNVTGSTNLQYLKCEANNLPALNVSGLTNLIELRCSTNQLTSIDVSGLTSLMTLICSYNPIATLSVTNLPNFKYLYCSNNQLTSLELTNLPVLRVLQCDNNLLTSLSVNALSTLYILNFEANQINNIDFEGLHLLNDLNCASNGMTSLDVTSLQDLQTLDCRSNSLTTLDISNMATIGYVNCTYNMLTQIDFDGSPGLYNLRFNNNNLSGTLDVSNFPGVSQLYCDNNDLTAILAKNGTPTNMSFSGNPNLEYLCVDDSEVVQVQNLIAGYGYDNCHVNSYCTFVPGGTFYTISGVNRYDENSNGCDASDMPFANLKLLHSNGTASGTLICDESGDYHLDLQAGSYTLSPVIENSAWFSVSPASSSVSFPATPSPSNNSFCIAPNGIHPDLDITILPMGSTIPGFVSEFKVVYKNKGTTTQSGTINFSFEDAVLDFQEASPATATQTTGNLVWNFTNLHPFSNGEITVQLHANTPMDTPPLNNDDILYFTAAISSSATDETPSDNVFNLNQTVVNSYDPNDKTCLEGATISPSSVGQFVHYLIRFENNGTANAQNIVVKDVIDANKYDVASLMPVSGSHAFSTRISEGSRVEFIFENINLPFDNANNDGYIAFKIKTKPTLVLNDSFSNTASIYFDYNFPIVTNTATTTVTTLSDSDFDFGSFLTVYPNPANGMLNISKAAGISVSSVNIYNTLGQQLIVIPNATDISAVDVSSLQLGTYFLKVVSDKGSSSIKFIKQ